MQLPSDLHKACLWLRVALYFFQSLGHRARLNHYFVLFVGSLQRITGDEEGKSLLAYFVNGYFADMVYSNKDWDFRKANKGVEMTRPLCAYPKFAKYSGGGDPNAVVRLQVRKLEAT